MTIETIEVEQLAKIMRALSDPIRLMMIAIMAEGRDDLPEPCARSVPGDSEPQGICVCEFQKRFGLGQSRTSYHLRALKNSGLVTEEVRGKWNFYALNREALDDALNLLQNLVGEKRPTTTK